MKRSKFLALVLVVAIMLMGAGYAYWQDTLVINNSMSTGELNVRFTNLANNYTRGGDNQGGQLPDGKSKNYWAAYVNHEGLIAGHNGPGTIISPDGKTVTTLVTNMYPGAYAQYYGELENNGTIPAVFKNAQITFTGKDGNEVLTVNEVKLKEKINFAFGYQIVNAQGNPVDPTATGTMYWQSGNMSNFSQRLNTLLAGVRLEPGQKLKLDFPSQKDAIDAMESIGYPYNEEMHCITYTFDGSADNDTELQDLGIHITINWKQHNDPTSY